jgi:hypothetical protein
MDYIPFDEAWLDATMNKNRLFLNVQLQSEFVKKIIEVIKDLNFDDPQIYTQLADKKIPFSMELSKDMFIFFNDITSDKDSTNIKNPPQT